MAQNAKSRRPGGHVAVPPPQKNGTNGSTNGFHKAGPEPPLLGKDHPLASVAGSFKDDPFWDEFIQIMKDERRKEDERDFKELDRLEAEEREAAKELENK